MTKRRLVLAAAVVSAVTLTSGCRMLKARDELNRGVQSYKNAQYPQAVEHFKTAVDLDPTFPTARLYLATAYMSQYIPGADSPENNQMAQAAHDQFIKVLDQDKNNEVATASIASLFYNQKKFDDAKQWYERLIAINPQNKEGYYTLGVIAWSKWYPVYGAARAKLGMAPEAPGPIKDKKVKEELKAQWLPIIQDGLKSLDKALQIDPEYDDAMAYENLLTREMADLDDSKDQYAKHIEVADNWVQKVLATKKIKAERKPAGGGITQESK